MKILDLRKMNKKILGEALAVLEEARKATQALETELGTLLQEQARQSLMAGAERRTLFNEKVIAKVELGFKDLKEKANKVAKKKKIVLKTLRGSLFG